ncbi:MAG: AMP-binding protein, partial [Alphaproteobacteria bacterium]|nr:AMP-binding protein [Alphaproteobacteria bacterium]
MTDALPPRRTTPTGWSLRWDEARAETAYKDGWWRKETCADLLTKVATETPERVLVAQDDMALTARGLHEKAGRLSGALLARFQPGSVISMMLPNWHEAAIIYHAVTLAGMVINPILPSLRDHELKFILSDVKARIVFIPAQFRGHDYGAMLARVCAQLETPPEVIALRGSGDELGALLAETHFTPLPVIDPDDVKMVMYTSGTTGKPKGVIHTHNSLGALIRQLGAHWLIAAGDSFLVPSPISHIGGSIYAFEMPLMLATRVQLMEQWDADTGAALIDTHRITHMAGATPFLRGLLDAAKARGTRLPSLKLFICGGASVPPALICEARGAFDHAIVSRVYGSTEVPVTTVGTIAANDITHAAESDGTPGIAGVRLTDNDEICARGPQMLLGYINPNDEAGAFDPEGYYRTGDQGAWVDRQYLVVTGRIKDIIIRTGENI